MAKFKFRFEVVEKVRKVREEIALRELSQANQRLQDSVGYKVQLENQLKKALISREKVADQNALQGELVVHELHVQGMKQRIIQQDAVIFRAKKAFEKSIRKYLELRKQTQIIEKLRERDQINFKKLEQTKEQKKIDELVSHFQQAEKIEEEYYLAELKAARGEKA